MTTPAAKTESSTIPAAEDGLPAAIPAAGGPATRLSDDELVASMEAELKDDEETPPAPGAKKETPAPKKEGEIEVKLDAVASKSIEATNRYRAQAERQLQQQAEALTKRETELAPRLAKAEAFEKAQQERDPVALAAAMGFGADELDQAAQVLYRMSKAASPADRAAAAQVMKQRQTGSAVQQLEKKIEELTKSIEQRDTQARQQAFVQQYATQLTGAVSAAEQPLVTNALKNAPEDARREMLTLAARMEHAARGRTPEHAEVVKEYEKHLRRQAEALGFDVTQIGKTSSTTTPTPESGQKKTTAGLTQDMGPQTRSRTAPKSRDEAFEETERELEEQARKSRRA